MRVTWARILAVTILTLGTAAAALTTGATPARASGGHEICATGGTCFNAWNGGPSVKSYAGGVNNDNFTVQGLALCDAQDTSTANCPITGNPSGLFVYQDVYAGGGQFNGLCVGTLSDGSGSLVACNDSSGHGGGNGSIQVAYHGTCGSGFNVDINRYWSNAAGGWSQAKGIFWLAGNGNTIDMGDFPPLVCVDYVGF